MTRFAIPVDIPEILPFWSDYPLSDRIADAEKFNLPEATTDLAKRVAVAISLVEQPGKVPVYNCVGLMPGLDAPANRTFPYGWSLKFWGDIRPIGYALIKEASSHKRQPFLAFAFPAHSLYFCARVCATRKIFNGLDYAVKWVGLAASCPTAKSTAREFEQALQKVTKAI